MLLKKHAGAALTYLQKFLQIIVSYRLKSNRIMQIIVVIIRILQLLNHVNVSL